MPLTLEQLREEVLALPPDQRKNLIDSLSDIPQGVHFELHPDWTTELERRMKDFESGKSKAIPWEEVDRELDALVSRP